MENRIIGYIEKGIVIDHLPLGAVWEVAKLLKLENHDGRISLGEGYESEKIGKKGVLKVEGRSLEGYELDIIALVAPDASVSVINNGKVISKKKVEIPSKLEGLVLCTNLNCISNDPLEKVIPIINYREIDYKKGVFICHYCKHEFDNEKIKLKV